MSYNDKLFCNKNENIYFFNMAIDTSRFPDAGMDRFMVLKPTSSKQGLKTSGIGSCFGVGALGFTENNEPVIGIAHTSHILRIEIVIEILLGAMSKKENLYQKTQIVIIGGLPPSDDYSGTVKEEKEVKKIKKMYNIVKTSFHVTTQEGPPATLIVTPSSIHAILEASSGGTKGTFFGTITNVKDRQLLYDSVTKVKKEMSSSSKG